MTAAATEPGWEQAAPGSPFAELIGPTLKKPGGDATRHGFIVAPRHLNRTGGLHGGMATAFLDTALAETVAEAIGQARIATIHLGVDFVDLAREGEFVELSAAIVRATRSVVFIRGTLLCGDRVIATANGLWKILRSPGVPA